MLKDQLIVITGGSSGLGLELAKRLAAEGARLTLIARDKSRLDAAAKAIRAHAKGAKVAVESLDVLINSAGMRGDQFLIVPGMQTKFFASLIRYFPRASRTLGNLAIARVQRTQGKA